MKRSHLASIAVLCIVLAVVGVTVGARPTDALNGTISPDPRTSNATDSQHNLRVSIEEGDAVTEAGVKTVSVDYGADERFNGSIAGVSTSDVRAFVNGSAVEVTNVTTDGAGDQLTITLGELTPVGAGESVIAQIDGITNPSPAGEAFYQAGVTLSDGSDATDRTDATYVLVPADLDIEDQTVATDGNQNITARGTVPNRGYVAVFTVTDNGTADELLGVTPSIPPNFNNRELTNLYPLGLHGNLTQSQAVCGIAYYETTGGSQSVRARQPFNRTEDAAFRNDGVVVNDTAIVSVEGSEAANVTAPTTCRPRPDNVVPNDTNGSAANNTMDNGTSNTTTPARTTTTPALPTTSTPEPTTMETSEPTTTETPIDEMTGETTTDETTETPTPTATATPEPTAEPTETPAPTPEPTTTSGSGPGFGIGLALAGVIVTATALIARRR